MQTSVTTRRFGGTRSPVKYTLAAFSITGAVIAGTALSLWMGDGSSDQVHSIPSTTSVAPVRDWGSILLDRHGADVFTPDIASVGDSARLELDRNGADMFPPVTNRGEDATRLVLDRNGADIFIAVEPTAEQSSALDETTVLPGPNTPHGRDADAADWKRFLESNEVIDDAGGSIQHHRGVGPTDY